MEQSDRIEQYLDGEMTASDTEVFEQQLLEDVTLREALVFHKQVRAAMILEERDAIRRQLTIPANGKRHLWLAAVAGILLLAVTMVVLREGLIPAEELYDMYYRTYPNVVAPSVRGLAPEDDAGRAFLAYDNGDFEQAAMYFSQTGMEETELQFYFAMSLMELHRFKEAEGVLARLRTHTSVSYADQDLLVAVNWYLALAKLKLNDRSGAEEILRTISDEQHPFGTQARLLLEQL